MPNVTLSACQSASICKKSPRHLNSMKFFYRYYILERAHKAEPTPSLLLLKIYIVLSTDSREYRLHEQSNSSPKISFIHILYLLSMVLTALHPSSCLNLFASCCWAWFEVITPVTSIWIKYSQNVLKLWQCNAMWVENGDIVVLCNWTNHPLFITFSQFPHAAKSRKTFLRMWTNELCVSVRLLI